VRLHPDRRLAGLGLVPVGRAIDDDLSLFHRHRDDVEVLAGAGTIDAQAGVWLVGGAMGETNQMAFIAGEKLVFGPIKWNRDVATAIDVGVKSPLKIDHKTVDRFTAAGQLEFAGGAMGHVGRLGDH
jgi:hypothetical protein